MNDRLTVYSTRTRRKRKTEEIVRTSPSVDESERNRLNELKPTGDCVRIEITGFLCDVEYIGNQRPDPDWQTATKAKGRMDRLS